MEEGPSPTPLMTRKWGQMKVNIASENSLLKDTFALCVSVYVCLPLY